MILRLPLWRWIEASAAVESVGHSGPAAWCFVAVFAFLAASAVSLTLLAVYRKRGA